VGIMRVRMLGLGEFGFCILCFSWASFCLEVFLFIAIAILTRTIQKSHVCDDPILIDDPYRLPSHPPYL